MKLSGDDVQDIQQPHSELIEGKSNMGISKKEESKESPSALASSTLTTKLLEDVESL